MLSTDLVECMTTLSLLIDSEGDYSSTRQEGGAHYSLHNFICSTFVCLCGITNSTCGPTKSQRITNGQSHVMHKWLCVKLEAGLKLAQCSSRHDQKCHTNQ